MMSLSFCLFFFCFLIVLESTCRWLVPVFSLSLQMEKNLTVIHLRVPRSLVGERIGTLSVVAQVGGRRAFVVVVALAASDDDAGRRSAAAAAGRGRHDVHVVFRRAHPSQPFVAVAAARVDRTLRVAVQRQRTWFHIEAVLKKRLLIKRVLSQTYCRHRLGALRPSDRDPVACNCCSNRTALRSWWRSTAAVGHWSPALLTLLGKMQAKKREKG